MCFKESFKIGVAFCFLRDTVNPIPTGHGLNQPIYSYHVTQAGRNRVKSVNSNFTLSVPSPKF